MSAPIRVPFVDLKTKLSEHRDAFHAALDRVLDHTQVILGPEVTEFEAAMADYCGSRYALGVANGTDALVLALKAKGIGAGDEVITTSMSYLASTSCIALAGATPIFADVGHDLNIDPEAVEKKIGEKTKAILAVHLAGNPAPMSALRELADRHDLVLIEDAAQAIGATIGGRSVGTFGHASGLSLHPLKNLGALGDAGVVLTDDAALKDWIVVARNHGHSSRDQCEFWSMNSRLDSLQAGFLSAMLKDYPEQLEERRRQATRYRDGLAGHLAFPKVNEGAEPSYNFLMVLAEDRPRLQRHLLDEGVETKIHYPIPIHRMNAAAGIGCRDADLPNTEYYSDRILSLPVGVHISDDQIDFTIDAIARFKSNRM